MPAPRPTRIRVVRRPGEATRGLLFVGGQAFPCALGRAGITRFKREGDGATPAARMTLLAGQWRADRIARPAAALPLARIHPTDGWSDDCADGRYNRPVRLPFAGSHEIMRRDDHLYDIVVVLDWNVSRRALHRGSAIFFHLAHADWRPTAGCVAVAAADMRRILARLGRRAVMTVE
ncbi:MAG: L,D-transpeptidase family protein [Hyphomicrobiaceae bacterium]|nr:L,D-transpeptidase family protein [Hyphomicrobiaceae bacterium]